MRLLLFSFIAPLKESFVFYKCHPVLSHVRFFLVLHWVVLLSNLETQRYDIQKSNKGDCSIMNPTNPFSKKFKSSPLTLDRILEGRPIAAQDSPLLRLPVMILSDIIKYMDSESLESLALVNSDCRQLARSCQFANVDMDYSVRSHHLFGLLVREATARSITKDRLTPQPSLGACIRYINLSSDHYHDEVDAIDELRARPLGEGEGDDDDNTDRLLSTDEWRNLTQDMLTKVWSIYDPTLILVLTSLPHLEIINWTSGVTVDCHLLTSLKASTVKHLSFVVSWNPKIWPLT